ncbi:hypothetical protein C8J57DRAFT_1240748 [Mycena rebaudengoi]|nr:hypothetical protein C8J57DRAFT_1240748 [Mycena rebaudengoi]
MFHSVNLAVSFVNLLPAAPWGLQLDGVPTSNRPFAQFAQLVQPHLMQMTGDEHVEWTSVRRQAQSLEYQRDDVEPEELLHTDKTIRMLKDNHPSTLTRTHSTSSFSEPLNQPLQGSPNGSAQPATPAIRQHRAPLIAMAAGKFLRVMMGQSKCSARPAASNRTFDVNRKTARSTGMIQTSRLPARDVEKHHPKISAVEFEFRYLEWIQWPLTEGDLMGPSMYYSQDRASCEEMLKIGMIRYPAIHLSPAENNPLIQVFDAALAPLAKLLVSIHPVVSSYKLFFTDLATEDNDSLVTRVERDIKRITIEADEALRVMLVATKPMVLTHKRYWDWAAFQQLVGNFTNDHTALDPPYRPKTYRRNRPLEPRRPPIAIAIDIPRSIEDDEIMPPRTRPRKDSEDTPTPKHQATSRSLRPRGNRGPRKEQVAAVPVGKVVA